MATKPLSSAGSSAPHINNWIGYLGLATPWAVIGAVLALAPFIVGEG